MGFFDSILQFFEELTGFGSKTERSQSMATGGEGLDEVPGYYLSGLQYSRDIGVILYGEKDIGTAERILREHAERNVSGYNPGFYGIGSIEYDGTSPLFKVIEVGL